MRPIPLAEARYQASRVKSATLLAEGHVRTNGGSPERWLTIQPFVNPADDPKAAADQLSEIVDKLKPLGWVALNDQGLYGRKVA